MYTKLLEKYLMQSFATSISSVQLLVLPPPIPLPHPILTRINYCSHNSHHLSSLDDAINTAVTVIITDDLPCACNGIKVGRIASLNDNIIRNVVNHRTIYNYYDTLHDH